MGDLVNLRSARKRAARRRAEQRAAENRAAYGRSKADRQRENALDAMASRDLDQHKIETGDDR